MADWTTPRTWSGDARDRQIRDNLIYLYDNTGTTKQAPRTYIWFLPSTISTGTEQGATFRMKRDCTVEDVEIHLKVGPVGSPFIVDINEAGVSIFSTNPEVDDGQETEDDNHVISDTALSAGNELTMDVDQIGSAVGGTDLTVTLHVLEDLV